jgi:hypothetical protein
MNVSLSRIWIGVLFLAGSVQLFAQGHHKVDCNAQFKFSQNKLGLTADILKKVSLGLNLDPQVLAQVDKWTSVALDQQRALCDAYKANDEATFSTSLYLAKLDELRAWEIDFFKMILSVQSLNDAAGSKGGKGPNDIPQIEADLKTKVQQFVSAPPNIQLPPNIKIASQEQKGGKEQ